MATRPLGEILHPPKKRSLIIGLALAAAPLLTPARAEAPPPSVLVLPLRISANRLFARLRTETPKQAASMGEWVEMPPGSGRFFHYRWTRGPLDMSWQGARFEATTRLDYGLEAGMRRRDVIPFSRSDRIMSLAQVGLGKPSQLDLHLATTIRLGEDWRVHTETSVTPKLVDAVKVPVVGIDLSRWVGELLSAGIAQKSREFDAAVAERLNLRPLAEKLWRALSKPRRLLGGDAWIDVAPAGFVVAPVTTEGDGIVLQIGLEARPRLGLGAAPATPPATGAVALPALVSRDPGDGFRLTLDGELGFADAERMLSKVLAGKALPLPGGLPVRIREVELSAADGQPQLALGVSGALSGTVALRGTPALDATSGDLTVPDLDYSFDAGEATGGLARLVNAQLADRLRSELRRRARWNVGGLVRKLQRAGGEALNRSLGPGLSLTGALDEVRVAEVATTSQGFRLRLVASGEAVLDASQALEQLERREER